MTIAEKIDVGDGYIVEIHYDEDARNPMKDDDGGPTLVLHEKAEGHFGWTTDEDWGTRLNEALERADELAYSWHMRVSIPGGRQVTRREYEQHRSQLVYRWMRAYHGVRVVLPVAAGEHSGTWTYLGDGAHWCDPGGWDSGWVGWLFATREQITGWGFDDRTDEDLENTLTSSFSEFESWVSGATYGYVVTHEDGHEIAEDSCWGFYGSESYDTHVQTEIPASVLRVDMNVLMSDGVDTVTDVEDEGDAIRVAYASGTVCAVLKSATVTIVHLGYMREQFLAVVEGDRADRAADEAEIAELMHAEVGS